MRSVPEWIGKTDDSSAPRRVKDRIVERQNRKCALTGQEFRPGDAIHYDHVVPLWLGGANSEANLQAVLSEPHKRKTAVEAKIRAKCNRTRKKHFGIDKPKSSLSNPHLKKSVDGTVYNRRTGEIVGAREEA